MLIIEVGKPTSPVVGIWKNYINKIKKYQFAVWFIFVKIHYIPMSHQEYTNWIESLKTEWIYK